MLVWLHDVVKRNPLTKLILKERRHPSRLFYSVITGNQRRLTLKWARISGRRSVLMQQAYNLVCTVFFIHSLEVGHRSSEQSGTSLVFHGDPRLRARTLPTIFHQSYIDLDEFQERRKRLRKQPSLFPAPSGEKAHVLADHERERRGPEGLLGIALLWPHEGHYRNWRGQTFRGALLLEVVEQGMHESGDRGLGLCGAARHSSAKALRHFCSPG